MAIVIGFVVLGLALRTFAQLQDDGSKLWAWLKGHMYGDLIKRLEEKEKQLEDAVERIETLEEEVEKLDSRVGSCEERIGRDWESWKLQFRIDDNLLEHVKHGNHQKECSENKDELHQHLLNNR